jgi:DNA-binding YbaB/EbfC family protein
MGNMNNMLRQAQKMQKDMERAQEELKEKTVTASSGGGAVTVTVTGDKRVASIAIKPEAVDPDDVEMLQDLILAAVNEAMRMADEMAAAEMNRITGGLGGKMPGMF